MNNLFLVKLSVIVKNHYDKISATSLLFGAMSFIANLTWKHLQILS